MHARAELMTNARPLSRCYRLLGVTPPARP